MLYELYILYLQTINTWAENKQINPNLLTNRRCRAYYTLNRKCGIHLCATYNLVDVKLHKLCIVRKPCASNEKNKFYNALFTYLQLQPESVCALDFNLFSYNFLNLSLIGRINVHGRC